MPLGTEVNLGPGDVALDGVAAPALKGGLLILVKFFPCLLWLNGWMDEDATWYGSRPRLRPHCVRWGPSSPGKGHSSPPPLFGLCLLWPLSPISATAELLYKWSPNNNTSNSKVDKLLCTCYPRPLLSPPLTQYFCSVLPVLWMTLCLPMMGRSACGQ